MAAQAKMMEAQHREEEGMHGVLCRENAHRNLVSAYSLSRLGRPLAACVSLILWTNLWGDDCIMLRGS